MKIFKIDFYKIFIVLLLFGFLFVFYQFAQNNRYLLMANTPAILDTRTGAVYSFNGDPDKKGNAQMISKPLIK